MRHSEELQLKSEELEHQKNKEHAARDEVDRANQAQNDNAPLPGSKRLSKEAMQGKAIFITEGCIACHTQQVRGVDMDKM